MGMIDRNVLALPGARAILAAMMAMSLCDALLIVGQALTMAAALTNLWFGEDITSQLPLIVGFLGCFGARQLVAWIRARVMDIFAREQASRLRRELLERTFEKGPEFVQEFGMGNTITTLVEGIDKMRTYLAMTSPKVADLMVIPAVLTVALFVLDWISGLIAVVILPCIIAFMILLGSYAHEAAARQHDEFERMSNHFIDTLRGIATLKLFGRSKGHGDVVHDVSERFREATLRTLRAATLSSLALDLFRVFALAAIAIMLGFRLMAGWADLLPSLAVLIIVPEYFAAIRRFANDFHASLDGQNSLKAILRMLGKPVVDDASDSDNPDLYDEQGFRKSRRRLRRERKEREEAEARAATVETAATVVTGVERAPVADASTTAGTATSDHAGSEAPVAATSDLDPETAIPQPAGTPLSETAIAPWGQSSLLELRDLCYRYPAGGDTFALDHLNLTLAGIQNVGIVGTSGAGKSTLVQLLAGFGTPSSGSIVVDGHPVVSLRRSDWLSQVTYIPQSPHLFHGSLRDNVAFYTPDASLEEVLQAIHVTGLDQTVAELPDGLDTIIGEGGRTLSGGQAQRVALARAFLDPKRRVLVFDEPSAHLDIETELALKERMLPLMEGRLVLFATHRLHWMRAMDLIVVMEDGRIVEVGTLDKLMAHDGPFMRLATNLMGGVA